MFQNTSSSDSVDENSRKSLLQFFFVGHLNTVSVYVQIQKLCDRVASSTLLEDRRDAVRALKSLSKVSSTVSREFTCFLTLQRVFHRHA